MGFLFGTVLTVLSIFLILLVLVQRGRGGGLTGALGGMGGSSAFGAKAGDVFTRITIVVAAIWIVVCATAFYWANHQGDRLGAVGSGGVPVAPAGPALEPPAKGTEDSTADSAGEENSAAPAESTAPVQATPPAEPAEAPAPASQ